LDVVERVPPGPVAATVAAASGLPRASTTRPVSVPCVESAWAMTVGLVAALAGPASEMNAKAKAALER
jgi:hypothetical protein